MSLTTQASLQRWEKIAPVRSWCSRKETHLQQRRTLASGSDSRQTDERYGDSLSSGLPAGCLIGDHAGPAVLVEFQTGASTGQSD